MNGVLGIYFSNAQFETGTSYACEMAKLGAKTAYHKKKQKQKTVLVDPQ